MSLKLALVVALIAFVGQGYSTTWTERDSSGNAVVSDSPRQFPRSLPQTITLVGGIRNCIDITSRMIDNFKKRVVLFIQGSAARFTLITRATKCLFETNLADLTYCGVKRFSEYRNKINSINREHENSIQEYKELVDILPKCLTGAAPPLPSETQQPRVT